MIKVGSTLKSQAHDPMGHNYLPECHMEIVSKQDDINLAMNIGSVKISISNKKLSDYLESSVKREINKYNKVNPK